MLDVRCSILIHSPIMIEVAAHLNVSWCIGLAPALRLDEMGVLVVRPEDQNQVHLPQKSNEQHDELVTCHARPNFALAV